MKGRGSERKPSDGGGAEESLCWLPEAETQAGSLLHSKHFYVNTTITNPEKVISTFPKRRKDTTNVMSLPKRSYWFDLSNRRQLSTSNICKQSDRKYSFQPLKCGISCFSPVSHTKLIIFRFPTDKPRRFLTVDFHSNNN